MNFSSERNQCLLASMSICSEGADIPIGLNLAKKVLETLLAYVEGIKVKYTNAFPPLIPKDNSHSINLERFLPSS